MIQPTPLLESTALTAHFGRPVRLKMESAHPVGSFKLRGMLRACQAAMARGASHVVTSSGGNAGYAVAWAARRLTLPATVIVPARTSERMRALIAAEGAAVQVHGDVWDDAHAEAIALAERIDGALIHPFDDPNVWEGHATLVHELTDLMHEPGAVVVAVGGGGLLSGVVMGLQAVGWRSPVVAVETHGAASYAAALKAGAPVTLERIDSLALTLGAKRVCDQAVALARTHRIEPWQCDDAAAVRGCVRFLDDHRTLVEPSCGAALAAIYDRAEVLRDADSVLVVVCGGAAVTRAQLDAWVDDNA